MSGSARAGAAMLSGPSLRGSAPPPVLRGSSAQQAGTARAGGAGRRCQDADMANRNGERVSLSARLGRCTSSGRCSRGSAADGSRFGV